MKYFVEQNCVAEFSFYSGKAYKDPFNKLELDVIFIDAEGIEKVVPGFWAGDNLWKIRFSSPITGEYSYRTVCSDYSNPSLHGQKGIIEVTPYTGNNHLLKHGLLRLSKNRRYLEHLDGTPFFWLGDTWWMGLCKRLRWPADFQFLVKDRIAKGFTVIQIVAGLYPDMPPFDERGANEDGFPWRKDYSSINPAYFDMADLRINYLVESGLVPCIVGCWGYFLEFMGLEKMKKHWRYLLARYGASPVIWCMAGEAVMPYYQADFARTGKEQENRRQEYLIKSRAGWTEVTRYLRSTDPYHHPITIHSMDYGHDTVNEASLLDIDMLQTGHGSHKSLSKTLNMLTTSLERKPKMPVLVGEVCYEGILESSRQEIQRFLFWSCLLSGAGGHTYGANGIWQVNTKEKPFGPSPTGISWGDTPWEEACQLPGSSHLGIAKRFLERYHWWQLEPHPEWAETSKQDSALYSAGIPGNLRLIFMGCFFIEAQFDLIIKNIEESLRCRAFYFDPKNGLEYDLGVVTPDKQSNWHPPAPPIRQDWVLAIEVKVRE